MATLRSAALALVLCAVTATLVSAQTATKPSAGAASSPSPVGPGVARAVLFYSENCPHCADVVYRVLPDIQKMFGPQLEVLQLSTADPNADLLYQMASELYVKPEDRQVPMMLIGDQALVGVTAIQDKLPLLIQTYLVAGGVDWPDVPGLREAMAASPVNMAAAPTATLEPTEEPTVPPPIVAPATPTPTPAPTEAPPPTGGGLGGALGKGVALLLLLVVVGAVLLGIQYVRGRRSE
jgi:glutaredoxin